MITEKTFIKHDLVYKIKNNINSLIIQLQKQGQIEGEAYFSLKKLKRISGYFHLFTSIQSIYEELCKMAEMNTIECEENKDCHAFIITTNIKKIPKVTLPIKKKPLDLQYIFDHIIQRFDALENHMNDTTEQINELTQKVHSHIEEHDNNIEQESTIEKLSTPAKPVTRPSYIAKKTEMKTLTSFVLGRKISTQSSPRKKVESQMEKQITTLIEKRDTQLEALVNKSEEFLIQTQKVNLRLEELHTKTLGSIDNINIRLDVIESHQKEIEKEKEKLKEKEIERSKEIKVQCFYNSNSNSSKIHQIFNQVNFLYDEEKEMVFNWIGLNYISNLELIYNPLKGEDTYLDAIQSFYNRYPLLIFIKSGNGCRFGGYTSVGWTIPEKKCKSYCIM